MLKSKAGRQRQDGKPFTNPPMAVPAIPPRPHDLGKFGDFMWDLVTPELERMTILGRIDLAELEAFCRLYDEWKTMESSDRRWLPAIDRMSRLAGSLGLTPTSRLRMNLPQARADDASVFSTEF
jgi:phage terminase small subunit